MSWPFAPSSPSPSEIRFLTSLHGGQWYSLCFSVPCSSLQPRHFFSSDQPVSYSVFCTRLPSTTNFLITLRCFICPLFIDFSSQHSLDRIQPNSLLQHNTLACCCPCIPQENPGLLQMHLLHILRANHPHVNLHLLFKQLGVPQSPLDAQVTGLAHYRSCKSSHLSPCLHLKDLLLPRLLLLSSHLPIHTPSAQQSVAMVDISSPTSKSFTSIQRDGETDSFLACCWCHQSAQLQLFLWAKCQRLHSRWGQAQPQQLPHTNPHMILLNFKDLLPPCHLCRWHWISLMSMWILLTSVSWSGSSAHCVRPALFSSCDS